IEGARQRGGGTRAHYRHGVTDPVRSKKGADVLLPRRNRIQQLLSPILPVIAVLPLRKRPELNARLARTTKTQQTHSQVVLGFQVKRARRLLLQVLLVADHRRLTIALFEMRVMGSAVAFE